MGFLSDILKEGGRAMINGYGKNNKNGSHKHSTNRKDDRTPAQKNGDNKRRGPRKKY